MAHPVRPHQDAHESIVAQLNPSALNSLSMATLPSREVELSATDLRLINDRQFHKLDAVVHIYPVAHG